MDVAALSLRVDSSEVVRAANDLDRLSTASKRAAAAGNQSGSIARMADGYARTAEKAGQFSNAASRAADAAQKSAAAASAGASSLARLGDGYDILTGKLNSNFVAVQRNIAAWDRQGKAVNDNAGQIRASTSNIAANLQDVGVTAAMGMNPFLIALQQGTQLSAALADGGLKSLGGALRSVISPTSLLTIAIVAAAAALIQWGMEALKSADQADKLSKAIKGAQVTTYALGDAQTALSNVFDLTTGKIKTQSAALIGLARAQLEVIRAQALADQAESRKTLKDVRGTNRVGVDTGISTRNPYAPGTTHFRYEPDVVQRSIDAIATGRVNSTRAINHLENLRKAGKLTEEQFIKLTTATASLGMAGENLKVYEDARKALEGDKGALQQFLNLSKQPKGGKSDAEKLVDIYSGTQADIAAEKARAIAAASQLSAFEAARLEKQTALLNAVQQKGIPITDGVRKKVGELADEYARAKTAADRAEFMKSMDIASEADIDRLDEATRQVGVYGKALVEQAKYWELLAKAKAANLTIDAAMRTEFANQARQFANANETFSQKDRAEKIRKDAADAAYAMDLERSGLGLTGAAAESYLYVTQRLNEARRQSRVLSEEELAALKATGDAYGKQRYAIDQTARAIADAREVTRGFFYDWLNGVREGGSVFKSFADGVINSLNHILDKLLDRTFDNLFDSMFTGGGGFLGSLFRGKRFASGGAFDRAERFANGGAFTNTIVNSPTLFRFAKGTKLGEMGEAGPEAIMPLKRGPNGALGVQAHGGGSRSAPTFNISQEIKVEGGFMPDAVMAVARQAGEQAVATARRSFQGWANEWDVDGAVAT